MFNPAITIVVGAVGFFSKGGRDILDEAQLVLKSVWSLINESPMLLIITVMAVGITVWVIYLGQLMPRYVWDGWGQHMGWAAFANQEGHLGPFGVILPSIEYYPKNPGIMVLWWIMGTSTERWANVAQAAFDPDTRKTLGMVTNNGPLFLWDASDSGMAIFWLNRISTMNDRIAEMASMHVVADDPEVIPALAEEFKHWGRSTVQDESKKQAVK